MKTPRSLQEYFETQTVDQKAAMMAMRMSMMNVNEKEKTKSSKKNPFAK